MPAQKGNNKKKGTSVRKKKERNPFFLFWGGGIKKKTKKAAKSSGKTSRSTPTRQKTKTQADMMLPDWLHWLLTGVIIVIMSFAAYYMFLRPYLYWLRPCQGAKEYGICLPTGFLCYGIDVSHHQGHINWNQVAVSSKESGYPVRFAIIKATEGSTFTDSEYLENITQARSAGFVCGAYYFYDPGTSPERQSDHYIKTVILEAGDFAPVVDVERSGRSSGDLQRELLIFIKALEKHYGVKPIIYASAKFRRRHLNDAVFDDYPFWVAHYYVSRPETDRYWQLWQFSDHASIDGIGEYTDFNVFRGDEKDFNKLRIGK